MRSVGRLRRALPEETRRRDGERVRHVPGVAAGRGGESALGVIADERLHQPRMAVEADGAAGMEVVENHVFLGQRVMIRRDGAAEHGEFGIAVGLGQIAEDLIVGAVLLDDEQHVLNAQRDHVRHAAGRFELRAVGGDDFAGGGRSCPAASAGNAHERAFVRSRTEAPLPLSVLPVPLMLTTRSEPSSITLMADGNQPVGTDPADLPARAGASHARWRWCRRRQHTCVLPSAAKPRRSAGCR